jgi:hypothetical protein
MKKATRPYKLNLSYQAFGDWTVTGSSIKNVRGEVSWSCTCKCGTVKYVQAGMLRSGTSKSCGCNGTNRTHGMTKTRTFKSWESMRQRCNNPNDPSYARYGGRGIAVCHRWNESFEAFFSDMGERPTEMTLDRIDNEKDYEPSKCRWATLKEQQRNRKVSIRLTHQGKTLPLIEWAKETGIPYYLLLQRHSAGWPPDKLLSLPSRKAKAP